MMYSPYIWPLILAAVLMAGIALYVRGLKGIPAARPFEWLMWLCALWTIVYALAICTVILPYRIFLGDLIILFAVSVSLLLLILALEYTGNGQWLTFQRLVILILPLAYIAFIALTSSYHNLFRFNFRLDTSGSLSGLVFERGPFYPLYLLCLIGFNLAACIILARSTRLNSEHFWSTLLIIVGLIIPLISGFLFSYGITPIRGYDYSSTTFVISGALFLYALVRGHWLDVVKIARDNVLDNIEDLIVVLDTRNVIVEFNVAAQKVFGFASRPMAGINPDSLAGEVSALFKSCMDSPLQNREVTIQSESLPHIYDLSISPIHDRRQLRLGRLFLFHDITDRKNIEKQLRENEERFHALSDSTTSGLYVFRENNFIMVNPAFMDITGYSQEELLTMSLADIVHPKEREMVRERQAARLRGEKVPKRYETRIVTKEGEERWIDLSATKIEFGGQPATLATILDITERKVLEEELRISHTLYLNIVEDQTDPICRWLPDSTLTFVNQAYCNYFGKSRDNLIGKRFMTWLPLETQMLVQGVMDNLTHGDVEMASQEESNYDAQGKMRWMVWAYFAIKDPDGKIIEFQSVGRDITDRKMAEEALSQVNEELAIQLDEIQSLQEQLREQAVRDVLTGLFNRRYMEETLEREISSAMRSHHTIGLLMIDLDHFKLLNDTYGHKAGDSIMRSLGNLLLAHTRFMDVACRYGGEEFVVIMPTASVEDAEKRAEELRQAVAAMRVPYQNHVLYATLSIGVAAFPIHGNNSDVLLRAVDEALYSAKAAGRNCVVVQPHP
jgi:diguanylate cyclase (GGDEF)-like protein/PAS domain S-box-containing protein